MKKPSILITLVLIGIVVYFVRSQRISEDHISVEIKREANEKHKKAPLNITKNIGEKKEVKKTGPLTRSETVSSDQRQIEMSEGRTYTKTLTINSEWNAYDESYLFIYTDQKFSGVIEKYSGPIGDALYHFLNKNLKLRITATIKDLKTELDKKTVILKFEIESPNPKLSNNVIAVTEKTIYGHTTIDFSELAGVNSLELGDDLKIIFRGSGGHNPTTVHECHIRLENSLETYRDSVKIQKKVQPSYDFFYKEPFSATWRK